MGRFYVELGMALSLEECQDIFDREVARISQLTIYKRDDEKLQQRIRTLANDVHKHMMDYGIDGAIVVQSAKTRKQQHGSTSILSKLRLPIIIASVLVALSLVTYGISSTYRVNTVTGHSMDPTLLEDDYLLINKRSEINRFDMVVATDIHSDTQYEVVKRVIGLPGDIIRFENDVLYINDKQYDEPYLDTYLNGWKSNLLQNTYEYDSNLQARAYNAEAFTVDKDGSPVFTVTVPDDAYFLMGDNRLSSRDSRIVGSFAETSIIGEVVWHGRF